MIDPSYIDRYSSVDAIYQKLDARVKLLMTVIFIIVMTIFAGDNPLRIIPFFIFIVILSVMSKLSPKVLFRRSLSAFPFLFFASLALWFSKGNHPAISVFLKGLVSVLSVIILVSTTNFSNLLRGLEGLKTPSLIVSMLSFVYRYVFIITDEYSHIKIARESRNFGGSKRWQWKTIGYSVGSLFLHSYERGSRVYSAMTARGYNGNIKVQKLQQIGIGDVIFVVISITYLIVAVWILS